ncbi:MAG TPA: hypothetical protein PKB10_11610, partial [Tepidisphaeraceae bacterium]|nr:hypothetical protein [Tepidisphaeraceae bacterium]
MSLLVRSRPEVVDRVVVLGSDSTGIGDVANEHRGGVQRAGAELRGANGQLPGLERLKDDFMSSVTHGLRRPLT